MSIDVPGPTDSMQFVVKNTMAPVRNGTVVLGENFPGELPSDVEMLPAWAAHGEHYDNEGNLVFSAGAALIPDHRDRPFIAGMAFDESSRDRLAALSGPKTGESILEVTYPRYLAHALGGIQDRYSVLDVELPQTSGKPPMKLAVATVRNLRTEMEKQWGSQN